MMRSPPFHDTVIPKIHTSERKLPMGWSRSCASSLRRRVDVARLARSRSGAGCFARRFRFEQRPKMHGFLQSNGFEQFTLDMVTR